MKRTILPLLVIVATLSMYCMSVDLANFNRADAAMALMSLTALVMLYTTAKWYHLGFMTFRKLKEQEEVATAIIEKLLKKVPQDAAEKIITEEVDDILARVKEITKS